MSKNDQEFNGVFLNSSYDKVLAEDYLIDENSLVERMLQTYRDTLPVLKVNDLATSLIQYTRDNHSGFGLEQFIQEYPLSTAEGAILMSLAEALLRIPDKQTAIQLTREQFAQGDWKEHLESEHSWFINLSTWSVLLTDKFLAGSHHLQDEQRNKSGVTSLLSRLGEKSVITAVNQAIAIMGKQFVMAQNIEDAIHKSKPQLQQEYRYTYDMLGEAALTRKESELYLEKYLQAVERIGSENNLTPGASSVSVKLSALHPRFEILQNQRVQAELFHSIKQLCLLAQSYQVSVVIDAEEADRLELTLDLFARLLNDPDLKEWEQLGIAVQTYQKRAPAIIDFLIDAAKRSHKRIIVRLVKGAYWDYEIKKAQQQGLDDYPVFTHKMNTELCYWYCANQLFSHQEYFYPQFASHNAQTIATIFYLAQQYHCSEYEFQQLYGMGDTLYEGLYSWIKEHEQVPIPCSIYAPVGIQETLLPYLVRRLIENGANNSFVNQLYNNDIPAEEMLRDIPAHFQSLHDYRNSNIPVAANLFPRRKNSTGLNLGAKQQLQELSQYLRHHSQSQWVIKPLLATTNHGLETIDVVNPANDSVLGKCYLANQEDCLAAMDNAVQGQINWKNSQVEERAAILNRVADLLEENQEKLLWLLINEAGKVIHDAHAEVREAVDFCRYYAQCGLERLKRPEKLNGYTGEENNLYLESKGVFLCISPWNFPLAIFTGQISAALMAGNCVLAKPASNTPIIAARVVELFYQAGIDKCVLQFLPAKVLSISQSILTHPKLSGVAFTGSYASAAKINRLLAERDGPIIPLIAETGGINAMLADSSALSEQLVRDMILSAFGSAGQRCSALRVAFVQAEVYDKTLKQLQGAMQELLIGNPLELCVDLGPLISQSAWQKVNAHIENMREQGRTVYSAGQQIHAGSNFIKPTLIELQNLEQLKEEIFAPVLHVIRFKSEQLGEVINSVNNSGFGLTFGIHSRIPSRIGQLSQQINAGNIYINRNMIGAVVGVQPFGGRGLSGTGPKAGGPYYLQRFVQEKTVTYNSTSIGGNLKLLGDEKKLHEAVIPIK